MLRGEAGASADKGGFAAQQRDAEVLRAHAKHGEFVCRTGWVESELAIGRGVGGSAQ